MKQLALHILDILQNSIAANATEVSVGINESFAKGSLALTIADNGIGMDDAMVEKITDPFYTSRTTRKVGLGIPLLKQNCELTGGQLVITSTKNIGTKLNATFNRNHIDMLPMGDLPGVFTLTMSSYEKINVKYTHQTDIGKFSIETNEVKDLLGEVSLSNPEVITFLKEMIAENLKEIKAV